MDEQGALFVENLYIDGFPYLDALVGGWFHQDFDLAGGTLEEVVAESRPEKVSLCFECRVVRDPGHVIQGPIHMCCPGRWRSSAKHSAKWQIRCGALTGK